EPGPGGAANLKTDVLYVGGAAAGLELEEDPTFGAQQRDDASQQCDRASADAHVAVKEEHGPPASRAGDAVKDRAVQHGRAALAGDRDRRRREVDPEGDDSGLGDREHVTGRTAADVE